VRQRTDQAHHAVGAQHARGRITVAGCRGALARRVTVLHEGGVLAEGSIDEVQANPKVIEVYLGV
jgi:ABC-type branched-subunit amino acid transport system ATPase component